MRNYDEVIDFLKEEIKERMHLKSKWQELGRLDEAAEVYDEIMCLRKLLAKYNYLNRKEI